MKHIYIFLAILLISPGIVSCTNDEPDRPNPNVTFKAVLNGESEATGTAILTYNTVTKIFSLTVTYSGLSLTSGHIHNGATGFSELCVFPSSNLTSPMTYTSVALNATQEADLNANSFVVNLHSVAYPDGEIKGLLIKQGTSGGEGDSPPPPPGY